MTTTPVKKTTAAVKPKAVPTKTIATAASKAVVKAKPQVPAKAPAVKVTKPAIPAKPSAKPAAKKPVKAVVKPAAASTVMAAPVKEKAKKAKLVRDSFTMPETEYAVLNHVKKACLSAGIEAKKSQLLRVGLLLLSKTNVATLKTLIANLEPLKAGRPKKDK
jgi:hypothetical protein